MTAIATHGFGTQRGEPAWVTRVRVLERHVGVVVAVPDPAASAESGRLSVLSAMAERETAASTR